MANDDLAIGETNGHQGGSHAVHTALRFGRNEDPPVRQAHALDQIDGLCRQLRERQHRELDPIGARIKQKKGRDCFDGLQRCNLSGGMSSHPVAEDNRVPRFDQSEVVFIDRTHQADVRIAMHPDSQHAVHPVDAITGVDTPRNYRQISSKETTKIMSAAPPANHAHWGSDLNRLASSAGRNGLSPYAALGLARDWRPTGSSTGSRIGSGGGGPHAGRGSR
jgi:hypothetical protein